MEKYLKEEYLDEITELLNETNDRSHVSLHIDLVKLQQHNFDWFQAILDDVQSELPKWDAALFAAQKTIATENEAFLDSDYQIKVNCHVRFVHLPPTDSRYKIPFPNCDQIDQLREVTGNVVRMTQMKLLELKREFICAKCKDIVVLEADYGLMYRFEVPRHCSNPVCNGALRQKNNEPLPKYCVNYQEIKIQEVLSDKNIPPSLTVTLDNDLVDSCQPGDCVTVCGTIERRWTSFQPDRPCRAVLAMRAVSLTREQNHLTVNTKHLSEQIVLMQLEWQENLNKYGELGIRDLILESICPEIYGMYPIKLAIALAICSGNNEDFDSKSADRLHQRGQSHILLIGDPGLAKSKLLLSAVSIAPRAVHTTGMGCSSAGLTAAAIKEGGEWQLEAGALVLADGGICCIDEFNLMRESDRASIHEAMEQQTISMAKAGIVCKLNTRCAILAAANPKNVYSMSEPEGPSAINIGIASPLLSRFDLVFILRDERDPEWDSVIDDHLLAQVCTDYQELSLEKNANLWSTHQLQKHFAAICNVKPKMTDEAKEIISAYYRRCRGDPQRDHARTTVRLLDSLHRLAEAHARLVFRQNVTALDAVITIRLMESTFGCGRVVQPYDVIKQELPLGPSNDEINEILKILQLGQYNPEKTGEEEPPSGSESTKEIAVSKASESDVIHIDPTEATTTREIMPKTISAPSKTSTQLPSATTSKAVYDDKELDRMFSLDDDQPTQPAKQLSLSDQEDDILSQALDNVESIHKSPPSKIRKTEPNRLRINFLKFKSRSLKRPTENPTTSGESQAPLNKSVRNRLLCTPSDDESTPRSNVNPAHTVTLNEISLQSSLVASTQIDQIETSKAPPKDEDSAYDTMPFSAAELPSPFAKPMTLKTPALFPATSGESAENMDLSYLDTLEF